MHAAQQPVHLQGSAPERVQKLGQAPQLAGIIGLQIHDSTNAKLTPGTAADEQCLAVQHVHQTHLQAW